MSGDPVLAFPEPPGGGAAPEQAKKPVAETGAKQAAEEFPFSVTVGKVYDGPMDLLLDLIRKQDIDVYDIPIARITAQFLSYVEQLRASDVDVAGEFIYMASLLIHIKSRMLLPRVAAGADDAAGSQGPPGLEESEDCSGSLIAVPFMMHVFDPSIPPGNPQPAPAQVR